MTDLISRREAIINRLARHVLEDLRCAAVAPSKRSWVSYELHAPYRYGWMPPVQMTDDAMALMVSFCPDLMAETTMWLSDEELDIYLTTIEAFIDGMVAHFPEPATDVYHRIQSRMYDEAPDALALVSEVEVRALDSGIVPAAPAVLE